MDNLSHTNTQWQWHGHADRKWDKHTHILRVAFLNFHGHANKHGILDG
jgi:hypothetical protein